ncbi:LytTR family transcriptional regulator DNA-binding domain-containing protein [Paenibacillus elgii]|uniref:LytTR family transcriptional regulator DNA-binding domain-containing protein n=1 Tax=Paenibacillus elgii TaxID=189691 RepID=UPI00203F0773|nr:LytTR family transcriptional regulator DNA-binding domain-containing protein [Paenibacillus elgii]
MELDHFILPVVNQSSNKLEKVSLADVEKITKGNNGKSTIFHIGGTEYMLINTLDDYAEYLYESGLRELDKTNVINMYKVNDIDTELGNVYFDNSKKRFGSVSKHKVKYAKSILDAIKASRDVATTEKEFIKSHTTINKALKKYIEFLERKHQNKYRHKE